MANKGVKNQLVVIIGATGTGKSQLAVDLATKFNGEIINGDAMQIYDGLPIITNKVTYDERKGIPHHLLGTARLDEEPWRVGVFKQKARAAIKEISSRGKLPILVGGTHYYTQSLIFKESLLSQGIGEEPISEMGREEINQKYPILGASTEEILEQLKVVDPVMANQWHPKDRRRLQRSLEIYLMTGKNASQTYEEQKQREDSHQDVESHTGSFMERETVSLLPSTLIFWVHADAEILRERLDKRVGKMIQMGLIDEVTELDKFLHQQTIAGRIVDRSSGIWVSIGFKEFEPYLAALKTSSMSSKELETILSSSVEKTKAATRQYAKRQVQWIRLKLLTALSEANALQNIYIFDGSILEQWSTNVSGPAIETVRKWLAEEELPAPSDISPTATDLLIPKYTVRFSERRGSGFREVCKLCNVTSITEEAWQLHLRSRRHRGTVRKSKKHDEYIRWKARDDEAISDRDSS